MNLLGRIDDRLKECVIGCRISEDTLDARLQCDLASGRIRSEQWFRNALLWYQLAVSYNNPYNHRTVHSELFLLHEERKQLADFFHDATLVFYGVGTGDTEIEIVDWVLQRKRYAEIVGIDVNQEFLDAFAAGLKNKGVEDENYNIMFKGYNALFEQMSIIDFTFTNSRYTRRAHICLGNTLGNFSDQQAMFQMFSANCMLGDLIVFGVQLDTDIDILLKKYSHNEKFARFVMGWSDDADISQLTWSVEENVVKATYHGREVFRSKKYDADVLRSGLECCGFEMKAAVIDDDRNACVQVYEKR